MNRIEHFVSGDENFFLKAIFDGDAEAIRKMVAKNPEIINKRVFSLPVGPDSYHTPLALAVIMGRIGIVELLLQLGATSLRYESRGPVATDENTNPAYVEQVQALIDRYFVKPEFDELSAEEQQRKIDSLDVFYLHVSSQVKLNQYITIVPYAKAEELDAKSQTSWKTASPEAKREFVKKIHNETRDLRKSIQPKKYDFPISEYTGRVLTDTTWLDEPEAAAIKAEYNAAFQLDPGYKPRLERLAANNSRPNIRNKARNLLTRAAKGGRRRKNHRKTNRRGRKASRKH